MEESQHADPTEALEKSSQEDPDGEGPGQKRAEQESAGEESGGQEHKTFVKSIEERFEKLLATLKHHGIHHEEEK